MDFRIYIKYLLVCFYTTNITSSTSFGRRLGIGLANCLTGGKIMRCFEKHLYQELNAAAADNETWYLNNIVKIARISVNNSQEVFPSGRELLPSQSLRNEIVNKLWQIAQSRSVHIELPKMLTLLPPITGSISNVIDNFLFHDSADIEEENTTKILKQYKNKELCSHKTSLKGRKKKDKDKNLMMMGGMIIMAMLAQMFLGKVILIAGAAFVMAKIALISSFVGSIKKGVSHSSIPIPIATAEHVYHTNHDSGGHHSHQDSFGWQ